MPRAGLARSAPGAIRPPGAASQARPVCAGARPAEREVEQTARRVERGSNGASSNGNGAHSSGNGASGAPGASTAAAPLRETRAPLAYALPSRSRDLLPDVVIDDGGPPRFISPYLPAAVRARPAPPQQLPLLLYLPGIDGTGLAAYRQFGPLLEGFDLRALTIPASDRTPFEGLVSLVAEYLEQEVAACPPERPVYLLGESFGGILALAAAAARPDLIDRLVLVNPATSFARSAWPTLGPLLPRIPRDLYGLTPFALAPFLSNPLLLAAAGVDMSAPLPQQALQLGFELAESLGTLGAIAQVLPPATLQWKLDLLAQGCRHVEPRLATVKQRTLLLASGADLLIPSADEADKLRRKLPRCRARVFPGQSHTLLQEAGIDLVRILREEGFYVTERRLSAPLPQRLRGGFGTANPVELPTPRELQLASDETLGWLRRLTSPVCFSTGEDGRVQQGLGGIPTDRPLLFVGNHQTLALDTGLMLEALLRERGILPRGLAHPAIWAQGQGGREGGQLRDPDAEGQFASFMATFGAVPVGAKNFFRLMQNGEAVLLYPGGVREAYKRKGEKYRLFWPQREEFVRMAARFGATIVPFGGVGAEDGVEILADGADISRLPLVGPRILENARRAIPPARRGASATLEEELFVAPFALPNAQLPRFYFAFRQPIRLSPADLEQEGRCQELYLQTKSEVARAIAFCLDGRERDPYSHALPRLAFEASWGGRQAPTFKPADVPQPQA